MCDEFCISRVFPLHPVCACSACCANHNHIRMLGCKRGPHTDLCKMPSVTFLITSILRRGLGAPISSASGRFNPATSWPVSLCVDRARLCSGLRYSGTLMAPVVGCTSTGARAAWATAASSDAHPKTRSNMVCMCGAALHAQRVSRLYIDPPSYTSQHLPCGTLYRSSLLHPPKHLDLSVPLTRVCQNAGSKIQANETGIVLSDLINFRVTLYGSAKSLDRTNRFCSI